MHETPTYQIDPAEAVFLAVDVQRAFGDAVPVPEIDHALINIRRALDAWRGNGGHVILTEHIYEAEAEVGRLHDFLPRIYDALGANSPLGALHDGVQNEHDELLRKTRFDATVGTDLLDRLRARHVSTVVVAGLTTPICVQATVDSLSMDGFEVVVVGDACASQPIGSFSAIQAHRMAIERMAYVLAQVVTTDALLGRLPPAPQAKSL